MVNGQLLTLHKKRNMNIVIIGATSGIGKALFEKYASGDNRICIVGRRVNLLEELSRKYPSRTISAKADITNLEEIDRAINALHKEMEHIDLAIVCSGTGDINATLDYNVERPTIDTNIIGWTYVIDMFYHIFELQGHGHLVAITSAGGLRGEPRAQLTAHRKPTKSTSWKPCVRRLTRVEDRLLLQIFALALLIQQWPKARGCFG